MMLPCMYHTLIPFTLTNRKAIFLLAVLICCHGALCKFFVLFDFFCKHFHLSLRNLIYSLILYFCCKENENGKVNQFDAGNENDQHNSGSYKKTKQNKTKQKQTNKQTNKQTKQTKKNKQTNIKTNKQTKNRDV